MCEFITYEADMKELKSRIWNDLAVPKTWLFTFKKKKTKQKQKQKQKANKKENKQTKKTNNNNNRRVQNKTK